MQKNHQRIHATRQDLLLEEREAGNKTASLCETVTLHTHCTKTATGTGSDSRTIPRIKGRPTREFTPVRIRAQKPRASSGSPGWGLWRWGESNQSGAIATKNGGTSRFAPLQRHKHARRSAPKSVTPASLVVTHAHMQTMERYSHLTEHLPYFLDGRTTVFSSLVLCGASAL